ncbi:MAG TPA: metallophosphoesterase family protein [Acidimicrobiales bacterium]|nr:metallophosphoesterase family protein [Acidimicrobiales bacterium]
MTSPIGARARVAVLADTHLRSGLDRLSPAARQVLGRADVILHAGDVVSRTALGELSELGPLHAVLGNNDGELTGLLPLTVSVEIGGVRIGVVHDSGARAGRAGRMRRLFPDADVVVFGHSHIPWDEEGIDGQILFNPGSATQRRRQPVCTIGELELADGRVRAHRILPV